MNEFDVQFLALSEDIVSSVFEYVNYDENEVEKIFLFGSIEQGQYFFDFFFKIKNAIVHAHQVNNILSNKVSVSPDSQKGVLNDGVVFLEKAEALFLAHKRAVPTIFKMTYDPKTNNFENNMEYDLQYTNDEELFITDVFDMWFLECGGIEEE